MLLTFDQMRVTHGNMLSLPSLCFRDIMNRSDSDSALSQNEARDLYKPRLLSSGLHPLQSLSSSLGELRGGALVGLASSCSTRSLWVPSDTPDGQGSSGDGRARRSPAEGNVCEDSDPSGSRTRKAFNKIFKKKHGRL